MAPASAHTEPQGNAKTSLQIEIDETSEVGKDVPFTMVASTRARAKTEQDLEVGASAVASSQEPGFTKPLVFAWVIAILGSLMFGYGVAVTGAVTAKTVFPGHSKLQWSICTSIFSFGGLFGAFFTGRLCRTWQRKRVMIIGAVLYVVAGLVMAVSVNISMLTVGRFLYGVAGGSSTVCVPLFLKEIAPSNLRGTLGTGHQIAAVAGVLLADVLAFGFGGKYVSLTNPGWRFLFGFISLMGLVQILLMPFVVESPVWLASANRSEEAGSVLAAIRGTSQISSELKIIQISIADNQKQGQGSFWSVLGDKTIRRQLVIGTSLHALMRFSGFNAVTFYANQILEQSGITKPLLGTTMVGTINLAATVIALFMIDRKGRRPLFLCSAFGMICSSVVLTLSLNDLLPMKNTISVASVMGFVSFFEIGLGPIPWTLVPEIMPAKSRATAVSFATTVNWCCLFIVTLVFPTMQSSLKNFTFMPFAVMQFIALVLVFKCVPETKGKTVEEIADAMEDMKRK